MSHLPNMKKFRKVIFIVSEYMSYGDEPAEPVKPSTDRQIALMAAVEFCKKDSYYNETHKVVIVAKKFLEFLEEEDER